MLRVALAMHVEQPEVDERREHRGTRPHHDPIAAGGDLEPGAVPGTLVAPEEQRHVVAERVDDRRRGRGDGVGVRDDHDGRAPGRERRADAGDGDARLVRGRRPNDERALPRAQRVEQARPLPIAGDG